MRIIFIRHAEPDYEKDSLTKKGWHEAELLGERIRHWNVTDFYASPLGRAQDTAKPAMEALGRSFLVKDWLEEFNAPVTNPTNPNEKRIAWDLYPDYLDKHPELFDREKWVTSPLVQTGNVAAHYKEVCEGMDELLASYGYHRNGLYYASPKDRIATNHFMKYNGTTIECLQNSKADDTTIVCFCHLGVMLTIISHLINTSPFTLWQGFFIPPSSVTVLSTEERNPGEAYFRCQVMGDTSHLRAAGEPVSFYGYFTEPFQG